MPEQVQRGEHILKATPRDRPTAPAGAPSEDAPSKEEAARDKDNERGDPPQKSHRSAPWKKWAVRGGFLLVVLLIIGYYVWRSLGPTLVQVVEPQQRTITETIAASGQVGGQRETIVGAQAQGVIAELKVDEGDVVTRGAVLARVRNEVAAAQVQQAEQGLRTAQAALTQAKQGARASELNAARARVRQADARRELARKTLERYRYLFREGAVARQTVDQLEADYRVTQAESAAARAQVQTLESEPRPEVVEVARQRVRDAEAAIRVARTQAENAVVRAPFAGTITAIIAERGAPVGPGGVVRLVQSGKPEIRVDVDESALDELQTGQRAILTSATFRDARFEGRVTEIGAQVDPARGTVKVTVIPQNPPEWLRPGQTINVNIVTNEDISRLVIPRSAVRLEGDRRVVLRVRDGRALAQPVIVGPTEGELIPVIEGLSPNDRVIINAEKVEPGARVHVKSSDEE